MRNTDSSKFLGNKKNIDILYNYLISNFFAKQNISREECKIAKDIASISENKLEAYKICEYQVNFQKRNKELLSIDSLIEYRDLIRNLKIPLLSKSFSDLTEANISYANINNILRLFYMRIEAIHYCILLMGKNNSELFNELVDIQYSNNFTLDELRELYTIKKLNNIIK
jgi:hypothetical protein